MEVQKGIPIPSRHGYKKRSPLDDFDWSTMEIGDSFVYRAKTSAGLHKRAVKHNVKIEIRVIEYKPSDSFNIKIPTAFRVWRVA
jgi:hypothetical protein